MVKTMNNKYKLNAVEVRNILRRINLSSKDITGLVNTKDKKFNIVCWKSYLSPVDKFILSVRFNNNGEDENVLMKDIPNNKVGVITTDPNVIIK